MDTNVFIWRWKDKNLLNLEIETDQSQTLGAQEENALLATVDNKVAGDWIFLIDGIVQ